MDYHHERNELQHLSFVRMRYHSTLYEIKLFYLSGGIKTALDVNLISGEKKSKLYFELELEFQSHFQNQPNSYFFFFKH